MYCALTATAQQSGWSGGGGHFMAGTAFFNYRSVNDYLQGRQLPEFGATSLSIGGGGYGVFNHFMVGGEGGSISASSVANQNGEAELSIGYGVFQAGYILPTPGKLNIYPMIGMGWGGSDLKITYADGTEQQFNASRFFMSTELNAELFSFADEHNRSGFKVGLCAGFLFNPQTQAWKEKSTGYSDLGNTFMNGPYIRIKVGGGGLVKK